MAFTEILRGEKKAKKFDDKNEDSDDSEAIKFEFEDFSFLIRKDHLKAKGVID